MRQFLTPAIFLATSLALSTASFAATTTPPAKPAVTNHQLHRQAVRTKEALQNKRAECRDEWRAERRSAGMQKFMKACIAKG